ncbi:MAG: hypothetical protein BroJett011_10010 [Chloroflexota bacterium]|nr:MAG: hypothetical protein BroJett011_10010 [Chloroflexota bacterium]
MQHIMIRIVTEDYDAWLKVHYEFVETRRTYGITDGPVYRDIDNPNAALFHIMVESLPRAMEWFSSSTFKEATARAKVTGREFYLAEKRQ